MKRLPFGLALFAVLACAPAVSTTTTTTATRQAIPANTPELPIVSDAAAESLLVDVRSLEPSIVVDMRYATPNNFTGAVIPGYEGNRAFLRREAAQALARVQRRALAQGYSLEIYDAYRPVRATLGMVEWTHRVGREDLLRDEYIASRSRHNLGLAVDLTLVDRTSGRELAMGTPFDTFSPAAHTANATGEAARNRALLKRLMEAEGFVNYEKEWWHYTMDVPNPVRFDMVVR
jgi:zinc D-Ala-D-Ala dipeptidase